ncbi:MAG: hypothetical protein NZ750_00115 [Anaerolineae bacterium]|nr:hypothetical protein [Anaerolineae bacterium]MDW8171973.1 hypothetical protein [Anaerolineae bacterium]
MINLRAIMTLLVTMSMLGISLAQAQDHADDCSRFTLDPNSEWAEFQALMAENNIPNELWADMQDPFKPLALEDYGISADELNQFFQGNAEAINKMLDDNPLKPYVDRALAIMSGYGLGYGDIQPLLDVRSDLTALIAALAERGLDSERADSFLNEVAPLVAEASAKGLLRYSLVQQADDFLNQVNYSLSPQFLRRYIDDLDGLRNELLSGGEQAEQVESLIKQLEDLKARGLNEKMLRDYEIRAEEEELSKYGVPSAAMRELIGDAQRAAECLEDMGLDSIGVLALLSDGSLAFISPDDLEAFYAEEMATLLALTGLDPETLSSLYGLSDDELLAALSEAYGPEYAAWLFEYLLSSSAWELLGFYDDLDFYWELALALQDDWDEDTIASIIGEYAYAYTEALLALADLDDETFEALFNDPDALAEWFAAFGTMLSDEEDDMTDDNSSDSGGDDSGDDSGGNDSGDDSGGDDSSNESGGDESSNDSGG